MLKLVNEETQTGPAIVSVVAEDFDKVLSEHTQYYRNSKRWRSAFLVTFGVAFAMLLERML